MKVIITGVAGFVGSNLAAELLRANHEVIGIDNYSYGSPENIAAITTGSNFRFIEADICDASVFAKLEGSCIVHLASQKIPRYSNAFITLDQNNKMLRNVVNACIEKKIKLVFASTSDVYGKNEAVPFTEESNLVMGPTTVRRWAYAISKIYAEQFIIASNEEFGLEYCIMRFFGSYGPNQNKTWWGGPQSVFIQNIIENKALEIHGDGMQTRTFTYVDDTVQGIMKCIFHPESKNEIFNIANFPGEEISIKDLAKLIWKLMKGKDAEAEIKFIPYSTFGKYEDVKRRVPCIDKICGKLDFKPGFSLEEGLKKTIDWQIRNQPIRAARG